MMFKIKAPIIALAMSLAVTSVNSDEMSFTEFTGQSGHVTTGNVEIVKDGDNYVIQLADNFTFDGAPDPWVSIKVNGEYDQNIAVLEDNNGAQSYILPASVNVSEISSVVIWCEKFSVPLGEAELN